MNLSYQKITQHGMRMNSACICFSAFLAFVYLNTIPIYGEASSVSINPQDQARMEANMRKQGVVRVVELFPTKVISFHVTDSDDPEEEVYKAVSAYAKPRGLWNDPLHHQIFGFDNPVRRHPEDRHGREVWITIPDDYEDTNDVSTKKFSGGLYAMVRIKNLDHMDEGWKVLIDWAKSSERFEMGNHQHLEGHIDEGKTDEEMVLELYLPIKQKG